jgi:hypothetical protein
MRNAIIELGTDDFAAAVSTASLTPAGGTVDYKGLKPEAVFTFPQATTYVLDLSYAQDWNAANSLSRYLWEHKGETVPFTLNPDDTAADPTVGSTSWAGMVAITPGAVGGDVDSVAVATVSLGVVGEPVPTFTAGVPAGLEADDTEVVEGEYIEGDLDPTADVVAAPEPARARRSTTR